MLKKVIFFGFLFLCVHAQGQLCVEVYSGQARYINPYHRVEARQLMDGAIQAQKNMRNDRAVELALQALDLNPTYFKAAAFLGQHYFRLREFEKASGFLELAHQNLSQGHQVSQWLVEAYKIMRKPQRRLNAIERGLELKPQNNVLLYQRVETMIELGMFEQARVYFSGLKGVMEARKPGAVDSLEFTLLQAEGKYKNALKLLDKMIERDGATFKTDSRRLEILEKTGDLNTQLKQVEKLLGYNQAEAVEVLLGKKIVLLIQQGKSDLALQNIQILKAIVSGGSGSPELSLIAAKWEAQVLYQTGQMKAAYEILKVQAKQLREPDYLVIAALMKIERTGQEGPRYHYSSLVDAMFRVLEPSEIKMLADIKNEFFWSFSPLPKEVGEFAIRNSFWQTTIYFDVPADGNAVSISRGTNPALSN